MRQRPSMPCRPPDRIWRRRLWRRRFSGWGSQSASLMRPSPPPAHLAVTVVDRAGKISLELFPLDAGGGARHLKRMVGGVEIEIVVRPAVEDGAIDPVVADRGVDGEGCRWRCRRSSSKWMATSVTSWAAATTPVAVAIMSCGERQVGGALLERHRPIWGATQARSGSHGSTRMRVITLGSDRAAVPASVELLECQAAVDRPIEPESRGACRDRLTGADIHGRGGAMAYRRWRRSAAKSPWSQ